MTTLSSSISNALNTQSNINAEVARQLEIAREAIGTYQAAQTLTNRLINLVPRLVLKKEVKVTFKDNRDEMVTVDKDLNDVMWLITLQSTLQSGYTNATGLTSLFQAWAKTEMKAEWTYASVNPIAKRFIKELINLNVIKSTKSAMEHDGRFSQIHKLTEMQSLEVNEVVDELRAKVPMKCKPLTNQPTDWSDANTGVGDNAGLRLITGGQQSTIAPAVLSAVNKLQHVEFIISPAMLIASRLMLDNIAEYNVSLEDKRVMEEMRKCTRAGMFFPVTMDKRGRMYYRGGVLSPQGSDFCKAAFQFAEFKVLGEDGLKAIYVHTANVCGMDKVSLNDRIEWVKAQDFEAINDFEDVIQHFPKADTFQATVAILEIKRILALDIDPATATSNLVCHQDGTCNGLQHMAAITGSRVTAESVNCTASTWADLPQDIYGIISKDAADNSTAEVHALIAKYGRDMAKNPVMIVGYGAGKLTVQRNTAKFLIKHGESTEFADEIGEMYMDALESKAAAVKSFTSAITSRMEESMQAGLTSVQWVSADGFVCDIEYTDIEEHRVRAGNFNCIKPHTDVQLDEIKTRGAMAPNLIHSVDSTHLRMVVNACNHSLVTVHDSVGSHPSTYFATAQVIREQFVAVHDYDIMTEFTNAIGADPINFINNRRADGYKASEALQSSYIFS